MGERILSFFLFLTFSSFPQTPLHKAAREGSVECGAEMSAKNIRSERVCERVPHTEKEMWEFIRFTDGCLFGCGG